MSLSFFTIILIYANAISARRNVYSIIRDVLTRFVNALYKLVAS